jgi:hypothetical protein
MTIKFNGVRVKPSESVNTNTATYLDPIGDPKVSLLLHMDGANNSTTFTDKSYSPKTITVHGGAKISTAQSKFGGASAAFDGSGDYLTFPASSDTDFGSGDLTIEGWVRLNTVSYQVIVNKYNNGVAGDIGLAINNSTSLLLSLNNTPYGIARTVPTILADTWYHFAVVKNGSDIMVFWNGTQAGASVTAATVFNGASYWSIGSESWNAPQGFLNGYLDEFRITKGLARYTANFTPPTSAFPDAGVAAYLPTTASVGETVYSSDAAYICTSASPVTWKQFSQTGNNIIP